ncbi:MAG TPA: HlyD family efflux transporter periplasmic adaptor subunit [Terriglobia bacterium]
MTENRATRRKVLPFIALFFIAGIAVLIWRLFFAMPALPPNVIALSGRIEGDDSAVAPKTTGRILEVRFREGDTVAGGDVIAVLDDEQIRAREEAARAALTEAQAKAKAARDQISVFQEQEKQSQLQTSQSKMDAQGRVHQAEAELAASQAELAQQEAAYQIAMFDKEAYTRLAKSGAVSERQGLQANVTADQQAATVAAAKRRVESSQGALTSAQANLTNPDIHEAQTLTVRRQIAQQESEIASAAAQTAQAEAQLAEAKANRQDLTVRAPFAGVIVVRSAEPGEVVTAGTAIVSMVDLSKVYLRGFISEGQIGNVKLGQPARVYLDSNPKQPIDAYVSRIDPQATFTPENTYFREDRVKQVVGVKLQLKSGTGYAKPGMPADGEVLTQGESWPTTKTPE